MKLYYYIEIIFKHLINRKLHLWLIVSILASIIGLLLMSLCLNILRINYYITIIITGEIGILLRYFPFAKYVYSQGNSLNNNIIKYHFACLLSFTVWFLCNILLNSQNINYIYSYLISNLMSMLISILLNYMYVWRK